MTETFLRSVRRRLRLAWALATGQLLAPAALGAAVVLTGAGRTRPIGWADRAALVAVGLALVALLVGAMVRRIPLSVAARAADRGLGTHDAFATALEVGRPGPSGDPQLGDLVNRVHERAGSLARGRAARDAVRLRLRPRRLAVSAVLLLSALVLGMLPNPQDEVARRRAAEQALLDEQSRRLSEAAAQLQKAATGKAQQAAAQELERAARELRTAQGLEAGKQALDRSAARLARQIDPNLLGMKAAVRGLEKSLAGAPLAGTQGGTAAAQLAAAANALGGLSPEQRSELASRLGALAAAQRAGDRSTAEALESAAAALRTGDVAAAAGALAQAGASHAATAGAVQDQEGAAGALGSLALAADALAAGAGSQGQSQGQGGGQAQGNGRDQAAQGQGQAGQGQGNARGQGPGQGNGRGQGQGNGGDGAGRVTGNNATTGSGQGGAGTAAGTGRNASVGVQSATVYDPAIRDSTIGEQIDVQGRSSAGTGQVVGQGDLTDPANAPLVPLAQAFPRYREQASEALSRLDIPPSMRAVVRAYFESLDPQ